MTVRDHLRNCIRDTMHHRPLGMDGERCSGCVMDAVISQEHGWSIDIGNKPRIIWEIGCPDNPMEFLILIIATVIMR